MMPQWFRDASAEIAKGYQGHGLSVHGIELVILDHSGWQLQEQLGEFRVLDAAGSPLTEWHGTRKDAIEAALPR